MPPWIGSGELTGMAYSSIRRCFPLKRQNLIPAIFGLPSTARLREQKPPAVRRLMPSTATHRLICPFSIFSAPALVSVVSARL